VIENALKRTLGAARLGPVQHGATRRDLVRPNPVLATGPV